MVATIASVAPQVTVTLSSPVAWMPLKRFAFSAIAALSSTDPQVTSYWL